MLKALPIAVTVLLLTSSCQVYQYGTVSSTAMNMNENQEFVYENDSVILTYNFNGANAPIHITLQNKLRVPVYIDWQRSALVINDQAFSYAPSEVRIEGGVQSSTYSTRNIGVPGSTIGVSSGSLSAVASLPPSVDFIPPQSYFTKNPMGLTSRFIDNVPDSAFHKLKYTVADGYTIRVKAAVFTETASPFRFKSYLTLIVGEVTAKPVPLEHTFFVSQLISTGQAPGTIWLNNSNRGNQFYISHATGGGGLVVGAVVVGAAAAASAAGN